MKCKKFFRIFFAAILCITLIVSLAACFGNTQDDEPETTPEPTETPTPTPPPPPTPEPTPEPVDLVEWTGVVEHLFFHEVIAYPELAFPNRTDQYGLDDYMITAHEFSVILESLYRNDFVLVNLNEIWSEFTNENGQYRMQANTLMIPEGKKPIVLSFDDLTFHLEPFNAFMHRYIVGPDGEIWAEGIDPSGNPIVTQDLTAITMLDKFIRENPRFSHNGAKGTIAQTGLHGVLGYRTQTDRSDNSEEFRLNRMMEIARVEPVIQRLHETGWNFASHSWGHIRFDSSSLERVMEDAERWNDEVGSLVGNTAIMIYAHGARLDGQDVWRDTVGPAARFYIDDLGFRLFASVGSEPFTKIRGDVPAVMMDRMATDGITLRNARDRFIRFYDAAEVFDPLRPAGETNWGSMPIVDDGNNDDNYDNGED